MLRHKSLGRDPFGALAADIPSAPAVPPLPVVDLVQSVPACVERALLIRRAGDCGRNV